MFKSYGNLSTEFYCHTKPIGHSIMGDIEYYRDRLSNTHGKILEAGVGTGRVLIPLINYGLIVDGIDNSPEMIEICLEECRNRNLSPNIFIGDLLDLDIIEDYEAIIMPTGSFALIPNGERVLENFYKALKPGGKIIVDLSLPNYYVDSEISTRICRTSENQGILLESKNIELNFIDQYSLTYLKYEKYVDGNLTETELQEFKLYYYGLREMEMILKNIGFKDISISSDYEYAAPPHKDSQIITFEAYK